MAVSAFRTSGIYIAPEMEGYLEKKSSGVLVRKTKTWCSIQGTSMYLRKNQGIMDTLNLAEAHQVKKVDSDTSKTSFEITIKKKVYIFYCSSSEECSQWVKALHSAMARKDMSQKDSGLRGSTFFVDEPIDNQTENTKYESVYATIKGDNVDQGNENIADIVSDYTTPYDSKVTAKDGQENVYSDINDGMPVLETNIKKNSIYESVSSTLQVNNEHESELYNDAYSQINKSNFSQNDKSVMERNSKNIPDNSINQNGIDLSNTNTDIYDDARSERNVETRPRSSVNAPVKLNSSELISVEHQNLPDSLTDDPFNLLVAALTIDESPLPEFNHPLTEEDRVPVKELTEFLANNHPVCFVRYSSVTHTEDPVASLKSYLKDLNLPS